MDEKIKAQVSHTSIDGNTPEGTDKLTNFVPAKWGFGASEYRIQESMWSF